VNEVNDVVGTSNVVRIVKALGTLGNRTAHEPKWGGGVGQRDELPGCGKTFSKKGSGIIEDVAFQKCLRTYCVLFRTCVRL